MSYAAYSVLVFAASLLAAFRLKERALYLIFIVAFTQNFVLAYLVLPAFSGRVAAPNLYPVLVFRLLRSPVRVRSCLFQGFFG